MAALAPPPFRPSPPLPSSSSSSTTSSATPSKKPENSAAVAAGRRRLEAFKKKKAAEKGKKTASVAPAADQAVQNVAAEHEPVATLPAGGDASVSATRPADSNGYRSKDSHQNGPNVVSEQLSLPTTTVATASITQTTSPFIPGVAHKQAEEEPLRNDSQAQPVSRGGSSGMDGSRLTKVDAIVLGPPAASSLGTVLGKTDASAGTSAGPDTITDALRTTTSVQAPPLGVAKPLYKPAPPPVRPQGFLSVVPPPTTGSGGGRVEPANNVVGMSSSPFSSTLPTTQSRHSSLNPSSSDKVGTAGNLVKLDNKLGPPSSRSAHEVVPLLRPSSISVEQRESASSSAKPMLTSAAEGPPPSWERTTIKNQTGEVSSSASSAVSHNKQQAPHVSSLNAEIGKESLQPVLGTSVSGTLPSPFSSYYIKPPPKASESSSAFPFRPLSEAVSASKSLPLPPLFPSPAPPSNFRPPPFLSSTGLGTVLESTSSASTSSSNAPSTTTNLLENAKIHPFVPSSFKPTPFLSSTGFSTVSESTSYASTSSSTAPSTTTNFLDNATVQPFASSSLEVPTRLSTTMDSLSENGKSEVSGDSFKPLFPRPIPALSELSTVPMAKADSPRRLWSSSSGGDDFAMLEQHIEDLTQDKFSLQRGLDAARLLADTLAQENSSMTEDYNKQGGLVNGLKAETERQQGEIRAQAVVVKKMKAERDKAVQESSGAVERSQALAAEVVELEEKVLRARSQELKLQREMESLSAETESHKRQISSLDKDRANLKTLMDALQEEKSLLQTQIRKSAVAASSGDSGRPNGRSPAAGPKASAKTDASTSTDDFDQSISIDGSVSTGVPRSTAEGQFVGLQPLEPQNRLPVILPSVPSRPLLSPSHGPIASGSFSLPNTGGLAGQHFSPRPSGISGRGVNLGPMSSVIPSDQAATIRNINGLITELGEEKEALMKALRAESVGAAELRARNAELSQKLEVQTQRLELAVAQNLAHGSTPRVEGNYAVSRLTPEYVDEGDEVVERVFGWIMQLFPSGSSRRKRL